MERLAGKVILLCGRRRSLLAVAAGAAAALSQPPFDFFAVCFVSFPLLVWMLDGAAGGPGDGLIRRIMRPFPIGWWFGFGYFVAGLWWTGNALLVEAELFAWAVPFAVFGLPAVLAVFYGLAAVLARLMWSDGVGRVAALAFAFGVAEWLRTFALTGFPWNAIGQAAMPIPLLMQSVGVVGMVGMNAFAVLVFAMPAVLASPSGRRAGFAIAAALVVLHAGFGAWRLSAVPSGFEPLTTVRIVQPSVSQTEKWNAQVRDRIFSDLLELSARPPAEGAERPDLILWPETSLPFFLAERPDALVAMGELVQEGQTLMIGAVRVEGTVQAGRYYNAVVAVNDEGETYDAVDKIRLVPFGEYLPLGGILERFGMRQLAQSLSAFSAGSNRHPIRTADGVSVLPFICYEIIFPGIAGNDGADADLILNVTNDAWFGDTPGPYQHFRQAQIRAVEAGLPLVRAANNGISGVIDAYGRVIDAFALNVVGVLDVVVPRQRADAPGDPRIVGAAVLALIGLWALLGTVAGRRRFD